MQVVDGDRPGRISVPGLAVPAGTHVRFEATDVAGRYRIGLQAPAGQSFRVEAAIEGNVAIRFRLLRRQLDLEVPDHITLESGGREVDLTVSFVRDIGLDVWPQLPLTGLRLETVRRSADLSHIHPVSPILAGGVFFEDLGGRQLALRPAEALRFGALTGELRQLRLEPGGVALNAHLNVRELWAGPLHRPRNLMPTWLEALQARPALYLWWGSALSIFTLVAAVYTVVGGEAVTGLRVASFSVLLSGAVLAMATGFGASSLERAARTAAEGVATQGQRVAQPAAASTAASDALHLIAMMRCGTEDDGELGAAIVFAVADERIYLATANHVVQACRQKPEDLAGPVPAADR